MRRIIGWTAGAVVVIGGGAFAWLWFAGGSGEPTTELTIPPIVSAETTQPINGSATTLAETAEGAISFVIEPGGLSFATFEIDEELQGSPQRVIGETDEVTGQVLVDLDDVSGAQFSQIVINARTFATDSDRRDRAIRGPVILNSASDEFELITFDVTSVIGLSGSAAVGDSIEFQLVGDLLIKDTTSTVMFDVSVSIVDAATIEGLAITEVLRSDFGIGIPSVPGVANVSDAVVISLSFVATSD